jgi:hypothetical protein
MFTTKNLFVTPYAEGQLYPAGQYVFQSSQDSGLAEWTKQVSGGHDVQHYWLCLLPALLALPALLFAVSDL